MHFVIIANGHRRELHIPYRIVVRFDSCDRWRALEALPNQSHECHGKYGAQQEHTDPDDETEHVVDALGAAEPGEY